MEKQTLTIAETAKILGIAPQAVRIGLTKKIWDFGEVVSFGKRKRYLIYKQKLETHIGGKL